MNWDLLLIKNYVQQVAEAIAAALGLDVMVFNSQLQLIAGTGITKKEGRRYEESSHTGNVMLSGQPWINRNPGQSEICKGCSNKKTCGQLLLVISYPIKAGEKLLGSFSIVATKERQKKRMLSNEAYILTFLEHMCGLISIAVNERKIKDELNAILARYDNVVNSIDEGIIVTDEEGYIIHVNRAATELLEIEAEDVYRVYISELISGLILPGEIFLDHKKIDTQFSYQIKNRRKKDFFNATILPVLTKEDRQVKGAIISFKNSREVQSYAEKLVSGFAKYTFDDIFGQSEPLRLIKKKLKKVALTDSTVLIRGESGTGKELFAHAVHTSSYRKEAPFIAINCSAIPDSLMESELFGYEEGAFTGARKGGKLGKFELASGGTIFLDELGDMPLHLQSKLLRVLETHCIERVGGIYPISIDVRIIAATNRNLEEMVARREFRGDLYFRLSVIPVFIPSLRERKEDILLLSDFFLQKYSDILGRELQQLDILTRDILLNYRWPGNVRELQNAIEYAINMSEPGQIILPEHLPQQLNRNLTYNAQVIQMSNSRDRDVEDWYFGPKKLSNEQIKQALEKHGYTTAGKEKAAHQLGISRATLYRRIKEMSF